MDKFVTYFVIALNSLLFVLHIFKIIYALFKPDFLRHKIFHFPTDKYYIVGYYLCAMLLMLILILMKLNLI